MNAPAALPMSAWSAKRRWMARAFALIVFTGLACAAMYLSGVIFLLLNKVHPRHAELDSVLTYWDAYADDPRRRRQLGLSMVIAGTGLLVVLPLSLAAAARARRQLHGSARFATVDEVRHAGLLDSGVDKRPGIIVGRFRGEPLVLRGQLSVMLSAPTRSGKGVGVVIPNLLNWPDSVVVLDIKGENYEVTSGFRALHDQATFAFSPFDDDARSHRWNPLTTVRPDPLHRVGDLLSSAQVFYPNDGTGTASEAFFNDGARNLYLGLGLYLLETPDLPRSIGEMLRQSSGQGRTLKEHLTSTIRQRISNGKPLSHECTDALQRLLANSDATLTSIVSTFNAPLTIFADAIVDAATSGDDFRLEDLRRRRMSIYVRIPPSRIAQARPLLSLFFSQLVSLNTQHLPEQDPTLKYQCLLVNDEFAALGRVGAISTAVAFLAGYNLRLLTIVQAMSQLDALYGDKAARTFATNHGMQILYAPREQRDAEEYSAMLGYFTERAVSHGRSRSYSQHGHTSISRNESQQRRALLMPQEFKELSPERLVVLLENCKPILGEKIRYHRERAFTERLRRPPVVPKMDMDLHLARTQQRIRDLDDELADGTAFRVEDLATDFASLPMPKANATRDEIDAITEQVFKLTKVGQAAVEAGGSVEPAEEDGGNATACTDVAIVERLVATIEPVQGA